MILLDSVVYAVIVCYNPDISTLSLLCERITESGCKVVLIDNSEKDFIDNYIELQNYSVFVNKKNLGIASAQNIGIKYAIEKNADAIVFFDQDSQINTGFLSQLLQPLEVGVPGVVSPVYYENGKNFEYPSYKLGRYGMVEKIYSNGRSESYCVDIVISSGAAATKETFEVAGLMDEGFFIDFVDTEWCLRCRSKDINIWVVPKAVMQHSIGMSSVSFGIITIIMHSPVRCYYQIRNCFHLFRRKSIPLSFAIKEMLTVFVNKLLLLIFAKNKLTHLDNYILATIHGIKGIDGPKKLK